MNYSKACAGTSFWAGEGPWSSNENAQEFDHFWDLKRVTSQEGPNQIMKDRKKKLLKKLILLNRMWTMEHILLKDVFLAN